MRSEARQHEITSIAEALSVLDSAAQRSSEEIKRMLAHDYKTLRATLSDLGPEVKSALRGLGEQSKELLRNTKERAVESGRQMAHTVDETVHENPWPFIGGAMAASFLAGFILARRSRW